MFIIHLFVSIALIVTSGNCAKPEYPRVAYTCDSVTLQQINLLGCIFALQNREDAALTASILSPGHLSCFTDGSRQNGLSGAGYVVYHHNTEWLTEAWLLDSYLTVFQAELDIIGKLHNPLCFRCGEDHDTPSHLFKSCITLVAIKCSVFGSIMTTLEEVVHDWALEKLIKFFCAVLCCYLSSLWLSSYWEVCSY